MAVDDTLLQFDTLADPPGLEIIDQLEQQRYQLQTAEPVSPTSVPAEPFCFPVDTGIRLRTDQLVLSSAENVVVRDAAGRMLREVTHLESTSLDEASYVLDLSTQVKTYIEVDGPLEITSDIFETRLEFEGRTQLDIGLRSRHRRPAATVTTTSDPTDVMAAVSTFGSALKSTSPERSFPTLRGHPPEIALGDSLSIPDRLASPDTGVTIEVPPTYETIYPVAPLAYYLGAEVVPGHQPRIRTDYGFEYRFDYPRGFERDVERTLKQVFLLDCVARTEGFYAVDLHERNAVDEQLDCDWATLYDQSLAERLSTYLDVPFAVVEDHIPEWRLTANVEPVSATVEHLPFVVDDLAVVRTARPTGGSMETAATGQARGVESDGGFTRSVRRSSGITETRSATEQPEEQQYIEFDSAASLEQAWVGDGIPIGASKLTAEAFRNRLDREVTAGNISITIILNDSRMDEERDLVDDAYGDRENLPFDVTIRRDLTVAELRAELREDCNFLHYIGHTEAEGFECTDGMLDAATLEETGVDAFLLNACASYQQGLRLIEAGAVGGIVTLTDILNDGAVQMGETLAKLLNAGFPLRAALTVARDESVLGGQYIVVGDGGMTVAQAASRSSNLVKICDSDSQLIKTEIRNFVTDTAGLGSMYMPFLGANEMYFLCSGSTTFSATREELLEFFELENTPIKFGDKPLKWSETADLDSIL